ncbi:MAG TPA: hypothetical protein VJB67_02315 [Patescibacteria group bacterium]|nr:hypothetical protein [Patescibacteria group bacterium]
MDKKLNALSLGYAGAILSAICMLLLGVLGNLGFYNGAVERMQQWHLFFSLSVLGIIGGIIEAAVISFVTMYLFGWIYNQFNKN